MAARVKRRGRWAGGLLLTVLAVAWSASAGAAPPADGLVNIGVILDEPAVEVAIIEALDGRPYRVIRGTDLRARATAEGLKPGLPPGTRALARSMGLSGIVGGVIRNQEGKLQAFVVVSDGSSGEIVARARWSATSTQQLGATVRKEFWRKMGPSIRALVAVPGATTAPQPPVILPVPGQAGAAAAAGPGYPGAAAAATLPPATAAPALPAEPAGTTVAPVAMGQNPAGAVADPGTPSTSAAPPQAAGGVALDDSPYAAQAAAAPDVSEEAPADEPEPSGRARRPVPLLEAILGARLHSRSFNYGSDPDDALANYKAAVAPGLAGRITVFPLRKLVPLGLQVAGESTASIASELPGDLSYDSRNVEAQGALVLQLSSRWLVVDTAAGAGVHRFSFLPRENSKSRPRPVPDVYYRYLRGGVALRLLATSRFNVEAGGFYRHVLHPGEIRTRDWFPRDKAFAIESSLAFSYRLTRNLEARAEGHLRRYQHKLNVQAGDARNASGAVDQHISAGLSLAWIVGGGPVP